jgi:hypothetical protein
MKKVTKTETIVFRTTAEQKEIIGTLAKEKGESPSKWIYAALEGTIRQEQLQTFATNSKEEKSWFVIVLFALGSWLIFKLVRMSQMI